MTIVPVSLSLTVRLFPPVLLFRTSEYSVSRSVYPRPCTFGQNENYWLIFHQQWFSSHEIKFEFLNLFEGIVVSGEEKTRKPFKKIYKIALKRYNLEAEKTLFIDDNLRNIIAANKLSIQTIHFKTPEKLENELKKLKLIWN